MPTVAETLAIARSHDAAGRLADAERLYRLILAADSANFDAHFLLGEVYRRTGSLIDATESFDRVLRLKPEHPEAHLGLALVRAQQGQLDQAVALAQRALQLAPHSVVIADCLRGLLVGLGVSLARQAKHDEAIACFRRAIELQPNDVEAVANLAAMLMDNDDLAGAEACCSQALQLKPDHAAAHYTLGAIRTKQGRADEAIACWQRAVELKPEMVEAAVSLATHLAQRGRIAEARVCYERLAALQPLDPAWPLCAASLCPPVFADSAAIQTWRRGLLGELQALAARRAPFSLSGLQACDFHPSFNLAFHGSDERPLREAYARLFSHCFPRETARSSAGRPRVGIVVTDRHETIFLRSLGGVLERLNSEQFELVVIGSRRGVATMRPAIRNPAVAMLPLPGPIEQAATAIRAAEFDLLYYWEVGTDATNYLLPFFRLAPVQCTSWGIQVTSGIPQLDYYISSELVEPPDGQEHYSERLVLASTLLTCQPRRTLEGAPKSRAALGIEPDCHLYLCAQQLGKFHPDFDPILAAILRRDLRATLLITEDRHGGFIARDLRARFSASMPDVAERIMFVPYQQSHDYMSLVAAADVLLDPPHFGGVNSSYDGFSLNRPIVTLPSRFQRGRYTWACYKKMGVMDCVASSADHYVDIAVALGSDAEYRAAIADKIREASGVLFDDLAAVREHERIWSALVAQARSLAGATHP